MKINRKTNFSAATSRFRWLFRTQWWKRLLVHLEAQLHWLLRISLARWNVDVDRRRQQMPAVSVHILVLTNGDIVGVQSRWKKHLEDGLNLAIVGVGGKLN